MQNSLVEFSQKFLELKKANTPMIIITQTNARGSAPQDLGAKMIVGADNILFGTVGGGKIEAHCIKVARELLTTDTKNISHTWNLQKDIGMTCGGEVSFLFENESPQTNWNIAIFGAGHVAQALVRTLLNLNCFIRVFDNREEWLEKLPTHAKLNNKLSKEMNKEVQTLPNNTNIICMTKGHAYDVPVLEKALQKDFPYIGVIGSDSKKNAIIKDLKELNLLDEQIEKMICPIGEPIGSNDPYEIAISITAQLLKLRE